MKSVVVFCGSSIGIDPVYKEEAYSLGKNLAQLGIDVVYGGNNVGLMGTLADGVLDHGGRVTGVLPRFLESKEAAHLGLTHLIMVDSMHERKITMHQLSEAVITLPGGFGTMEEFFEMLTWHQLGLHSKPIFILNTKGYYNHLLLQMEQMVEEGFLHPSNRDRVTVLPDVETLVSAILQSNSNTSQIMHSDRV